jgi:hypothetical protein
MPQVRDLLLSKCAFFELDKELVVQQNLEDDSELIQVFFQ